MTCNERIPGSNGHIEISANSDTLCKPVMKKTDTLRS